MGVAEVVTVVDTRRTVREEREKLMRTETQLRAKEESSMEIEDQIPEEVEKGVEEIEMAVAEEEVAVAEDIIRTENHMMVSANLTKAEHRWYPSRRCTTKGSWYFGSTSSQGRKLRLKNKWLDPELRYQAKDENLILYIIILLSLGREIYGRLTKVFCNVSLSIILVKFIVC